MVNQVTRKSGSRISGYQNIRNEETHGHHGHPSLIDTHGERNI